MWITTLIVSAAGLAAWQLPASEEADALSRRADERIRGLQREADDLAARTRTLLEDLRALEVDRALAEERAAEADRQVDRATEERDVAAAEVAALEARRVAGTPGVAERLVSIYKRGRGGYARLLLSADDPRAFGRLTRGVAAVATLDRVRIDAHRRTLADERAALADLETRRGALVELQRTAAQARADVDKAVAARNASIDALDERRDLAAQYVSELLQAQAALQQTVGQMSDTPPDLPFQPFRGTLDWPVRGRLLSRFGPSRQGRFGTAIVRNGVEIAAAEGTTVQAVHGGTVAFAEPFTGFGTIVILDHGGGAFTMYGHLRESLVERGMRLPRHGDIGRTGVSPEGTAALYFEVRIDGRPVDPLQWLRSSP